ncbi:MAG: sulfatase-like hydrolase/transferase [Dokdonella sp.]|uniref:sulfatase-like hydrolase/transferase n=1 Tax=Dokdonella sp. TaxID=2291710 RepID=UPI0025BA26C1|nr:sulfatase-like hydrolase/transferase [Dokdonella sp.]MBZ0222977.1 sulfatase-like hydrolase/transferase [Dokdonella sp.]MCC7255954.1 sulfatase-like hydrolase/transferase [Dokdonella sp.]
MTFAPDRKTSLRALLAIAIAATMFWWVTLRVLTLETDTLAQTSVIALMLCGAFWFAVTTGRLAFGVFAATFLMGVIWLASSIKVAFLHEPLMVPDISYFGGTLTRDVIAHYPGMLRKSLIALLGGGTLGVLLWRLESPGRWPRGRTRLRLLATSLAILPLLVCLAPRGPFRALYNTGMWEFISQGRSNPITSFIRSFAEMQIVLPARAQQIDVAQWQTPETATTTAPRQRPDIVAILEESTLDPRQWAACSTPLCTFKMFEADADTRALGTLRVHTYGGGTWTSEFAFFTGLAHTSFGAAGWYAPFNLAPRLKYSLPRHLKSLGYHNVAIYPMGADFVGAQVAYKDYGFDEFHDSNELKLLWESTDGDLLTKVEAIYAKLRAGDERPLFVMILTMRQHGPHDYPLDTLPPPWNKPPFPQLDAALNRNLANYLHRMQQSDSALTQLRSFLFAQSRPTLLVHFGDHHPGFDGLERTLIRNVPGQSATEAMNDTYYRIDTNYPGAHWLAPPVLDLAFLASAVLDVAGLPKGEYFEANTRLREDCHGLLEGCAPATLESYYGYVFDTLGGYE